MSTSNTDERDTKLRSLVKTIFERVPKEKRLTAAVLMQLLNTKYANVFSPEYLAERTGLLSDIIDSFYNSRVDEVKNSNNNCVNKKQNEKANDEESDDEEEEDGDDDEEDTDEEEVEDEDEEEDEEEDDDVTSDVSDRSGADDDVDSCAQASKRARKEYGDNAVERRCQEMMDCLRRLSYRVRKQGETESSEVYLQECLVPFFREKGLDPEKYSRADVKRYSVMRELQQLQEDGADITLDRSARAGRGFNNLLAKKDMTMNVKTSKFLDEE